MTKAPDGTGTGWGSHQPALKALAAFTPITTVIEFGSGPFSTHLFLDREAFPDLRSLVSFEHDMTWVEKTWVADHRHALIISQPETFAARSRDMEADFVFLGCAPQSIRVALRTHAMTLAPIVGMHDAEEGDLNDLGYKHVKGFERPVLTVFGSNTIDLSKLEIE